MANYVTAAEVRAIAGFNNNANILDATITGHINRAHGVIRSHIGGRYSLSSLNTNFTGSDAEQFLKSVELYLAAGYLLIAEYGPDSNSEGTITGQTWIQNSLDQIKDIENSNVRLFDANGTEFGLVSTSRQTISGYPYGAETEPARSFSVDQVF